MILAAILLPAVHTTGATNTAPRRSIVAVPERTAPFALPPLARPLPHEPSNPGWHQNGTLGAGFAQARRDFEQTLSRQGWQRLKTIPVGRDGHPAEITTWARGARRVILMLWARDVAQSEFAWKEET